MIRRGAPAVLVCAVFLLLGLLGRPSLWGASGEDVYIVHLKQPSLVEQMLDESRGRPAFERRRMLESPQALAYRAEVQSRQQDFLRRLDERGLLRSAKRPQGVLQLLERRSYLINMLVVRTTAKAANDLTALAEVRGVFENTEFRPHLDTAPGIIGAPAAWELLGGQGTAGAGIKIGVIDSGIAHLHPMFRPDGLTAPPGFPRRQIDFTNAKVIVAENYVREAFGYNPQPEQSPRPEFGHGTQVAGAAAGRPADSTLAHLSGIAPGAFLGNYKVFGDPETNASARFAGLIAAFNDAVADSMDVINMSLGGGVPATPEQDPFHISISNAVDLGIVVVISAGNNGPRNETISWPAINPDALSVGSVSNGRIFGQIMEVGSAQGNLPDELSSVTFVAGTGVQINQDIGPLEMRSVLEADPTETACSPLPPASLSGIVLVRRGDCFFVDKADNVFAAGAQAMVVYNNQGEAFRMGLPDSRSFSGPSVMISQQEGEGLRDFVQAQSASATLQSAVEAIPIQADVVSGFSSRGPNFRSNLTGIKPDLVAVGQQVHTSTSSSAMYVITQGTSFSAPMVAGGAALVRHRHPNWDARAVKSALVNTALPSPTLDGQPAGVLERGNGLLDLSRALDVPVVLDPVGFSFGSLTEADLVTPSGSASGTTLIKMFKVSNPGESSLQLEIEVVPVKAVAGTLLSLSSSSLDLAAGQSASLTLGLQLNGSTIQGEFEGILRIRESASQREVTASYWGLAAIGLDDSVVLRVAKDGSQPFQTLTAALDQAGPGNIIEITDSGSYQEPFIVNGGSFRRLNGLTLRSAPGESPLLEGEVSMTDVPGVTLEGLTFGNSVSLIRSDGVIRDSLFTSVAATGVGGLSINDGIYHVFGNSFHTDQGVGLDASSAAALIQHNAFGRQPGGGATQAGAIRGSSSLLSIFDNAIAGATAVGGPNLGPGERGGVAFDSSPSVLFKGNTVAETQLGPAVRSNSVGDLLMISNAIRDNQGPGISLGDFNQAFLQGGTISGNQGPGVQAEGGSPISAQAVRLNGNTAGFLLDGSSLSLRDSLITGSFGGSGNGIEILAASLTVTNSTITGNSGQGILSPGSTGAISNSILFANAGGDLSAQAELLASGKGNLAGVDPLFVSPLDGDYSLSPGSAAIDAGLDASVLSLSDLDGHQRIAASAVDQGALESASEHAPALILPVFSVDSAEFVGLAMTNAQRPAGSPEESLSPGGTLRDSAAQVEMRAYDSNGELYSTFNTDLASESQFSILLDQAFQGLRPGWVEILSNRPDLLSFSLLGRPQGAGLEFLDGAALSSAQQGPLFLPEVRSAEGEDTWIYLVNPSESPLDILIEWVRPDGSIRQQNRRLDAQGMFSSTVRELFGEGTQGLIRLMADAQQSFYAMEIFGTSRSRGGLLALEQSAAAATLFAAQLAVGPSIETFIQAVPLDTDELIFEAFDELGQVAASITVTGLTTGTANRLRARTLFNFAEAASFVGWLRVRTTAEGGSVLGSVSFEHPEGDFLAALPLQSQGAREFVLSHVAENDQIFTGLTLLNPDLTPSAFPSSAAVSVEIFGLGGRRVGLALLTLAPGEKQARLLSELAPQLGQRDSGFVRVRSNRPVLGFELFGNNSSRFLSAVPAQWLVR